MKKLFILATIGLMFCLCFSVNSVSSNEIEILDTTSTFYVDDDFNETTPGWKVTNFSSIQDAIGKTENNDTVFVFSGNYHEFYITIWSSIDLTGEDKHTTIINNTGISICGDNVKVSGFTIQNEQYGIQVGSCSGAEISDNIITLNGFGINSFEAKNIKIFRNVISNNKRGIWLYSLKGDNLVEQNKIESNTVDGLSVSCFNMYYYDGLTIKNNNFIDNKKSIDIDMLGKINFQNNYWERPRILPKIMPGIYTRYDGLKIYRFYFDWHPALKPHDINQ